jgi:hypothetical protein
MAGTVFGGHVVAVHDLVCVPVVEHGPVGAHEPAHRAVGGQAAERRPRGCARWRPPPESPGGARPAARPRCGATARGPAPAVCRPGRRPRAAREPWQMVGAAGPVVQTSSDGEPGPGAQRPGGVAACRWDRGAHSSASPARRAPPCCEQPGTRGSRSWTTPATTTSRAPPRWPPAGPRSCSADCSGTWPGPGTRSWWPQAVVGVLALGVGGGRAGRLAAPDGPRRHRPRLLRASTHRPAGRGGGVRHRRLVAGASCGRGAPSTGRRPPSPQPCVPRPTRACRHRAPSSSPTTWCTATGSRAPRCRPRWATATWPSSRSAVQAGGALSGKYTPAPAAGAAACPPSSPSRGWPPRSPRPASCPPWPQGSTPPPRPWRSPRPRQPPRRQRPVRRHHPRPDHDQRGGRRSGRPPRARRLGALRAIGTGA